MNGRRALPAIIAWMTLAVAISSAAHAQTFAEHGPTNDLLFIRIAAGLVICTLAAAAAALFLKRLQGRAPFSFAALGVRPFGPALAGLHIVETRRLSLHGDVCRLTCAGKEFVIVVTPGGATLLHEGARPSDQPESAP